MSSQDDPDSLRKKAAKRVFTPLEKEKNRQFNSKKSFSSHDFLSPINTLDQPVRRDDNTSNSSSSSSSSSSNMDSSSISRPSMRCGISNTYSKKNINNSNSNSNDALRQQPTLSLDSSHSFEKSIKESFLNFPIKTKNLPGAFSSSSSSSFQDILSANPHVYHDESEEREKKPQRIIPLDSSSSEDEGSSKPENTNFKSKTYAKSEELIKTKTEFSSTNVNTERGTCIELSSVQYRDILFPTIRGPVLYENIQLRILQRTRILVLSCLIDSKLAHVQIDYSKVSQVQFIKIGNCPEDWYVDLFLSTKLDIADAFNIAHNEADMEIYKSINVLRLCLRDRCGHSPETIENILSDIVNAGATSNVKSKNSANFVIATEKVRLGELASPKRNISTFFSKSPSIRSLASPVIPSLASLWASDSVKLASKPKKDVPVRFVCSTSSLSRSSPDVFNNDDDDFKSKIRVRKSNIDDKYTAKSKSTSSTPSPALGYRTSLRLSRIKNRKSPSDSAHSAAYVDPDLDLENAKVLFCYPEGELDSIPVTSNELERLQPGIWFNDTLIDFELKYIFTSLNKNLQEKTFMFNSFFYKRLTSATIPTKVSVETKESDSGNEREGAESSPVKNSKSISTAKTETGTGTGTVKRNGFDIVKSWTRKVNIFEKDFLIVPINEDLHWYVAVICYPGKLLLDIYDEKANEEIDDDDDKRPRILVFDSLSSANGARAQKTANRLSCYLIHEAYDKLKIIRNKKVIKKHSVEVPQQDNFTDCGCFLLQFVEEFLAGPPEKIIEADDLSDWFPRTRAQDRRRVMRERIALFAQDYEIRQLNRKDLEGGLSKKEEFEDRSSDIEEVIL